VSTPGTTLLHGAQLWLVLPSASADVEPRFEHHAPEVVQVADGVRAQVFVGSLWGSASPVRVETPLVGAEVVLAPGAVVDVPVEPGFEVAVLVDRGSVSFAGRDLARAELGVVEAARHPTSTLVAAGDEGARVLVLGGEPFGEQVVMWWNFIGRSHEDVVAAREAWEDGASSAAGRFGRVEGYAGEVSRIPAPGLPGVRLRPRGNRGRRGDGAGRGASGFEGAEAPALS
jgi:redox-sensitive bicupin YhaK (pirin superfamily)